MIYLMILCIITINIYIYMVKVKMFDFSGNENNIYFGTKFKTQTETNLRDKIFKPN